MKRDSHFIYEMRVGRVLPKSNSVHELDFVVSLLDGEFAARSPMGLQPYHIPVQDVILTMDFLQVSLMDGT